MYCVNHHEEPVYANYIREGNSYCDECYYDNYVWVVDKANRLEKELKELKQTISRQLRGKGTPDDAQTIRDLRDYNKGIFDLM